MFRRNFSNDFWTSRRIFGNDFSDLLRFLRWWKCSKMNDNELNDCSLGHRSGISFPIPSFPKKSGLFIIQLWGRKKISFAKHCHPLLWQKNICLQDWFKRGDHSPEQPNSGRQEKVRVDDSNTQSTQSYHNLRGVMWQPGIKFSFKCRILGIK